SREILRFGERELAEFRARARDGAPAERRAAGRQPGRRELAREGGDTLAPHVDEDDVLHRGRARLAIAVSLGRVRQRAELCRRDPPAQHGGAGIAEVWLALRMDADVVTIDVFGPRLVRRAIERIAQARLDLVQEALGGPAVSQEEKLQSRLLAI